jgi:hypothetical protein
MYEGLNVDEFSGVQFSIYFALYFNLIEKTRPKQGYAHGLKKTGVGKVQFLESVKRF